MSWYWRVASFTQLTVQRVLQAITLPLALYSSMPAHASNGLASSNINIGCFTNSTVANLEDLVTCFEQHTVGPDFYDAASYAAAQPTAAERTAWSEAVRALLDVDGNCDAARILPPVLRGIYTVTLFTERSSPSSSGPMDEPANGQLHGPAQFCVLSERIALPDTGFYVRGWGLVAVPARRANVRRAIHFAAPHPIFDLFTATQAAALFRRTGAKSLLITGRTRQAFHEATNCIVPSPPYFHTDPAHDNLEPFFDAAKVIWEWQNEHDGCPSASCAFIQMHGKGASTCPLIDVFLSTGLGNSSSSIAWYESSDDAPIKRLRKQLLLAFPSSNMSFSSDDPFCDLTATTNVFGRLVNGINPRNGFFSGNDVCTTASNATLVTGQFIHLEQRLSMRMAENYDAWGNALRKTFSSS